MRVIRLHGHPSTPMVKRCVPEVRLEGPIIELAAYGRPLLEPKLAIVLAGDVSSGALPGDVARTVTGVFLAVDVLDTSSEDFEMPLVRDVAGGGVLLGEQLLPLELVGELRLYLRGELVATESVAGMGDPISRIACLASEVDGLHAGDAVLMPAASAPAGSVTATSGTLLLEGPLGAMLAADLRGAA